MAKSHFIFFFLGITGLAFSAFSDLLLPERFFFDAKTILNKPNLTGSYLVTSRFYKLTGLALLPLPIIAIIQYSFVLYILKKIGIPKNFTALNLKNLVLYSSFFILAVFLSMPTKEMINFTFIFILVLLFQSKKFSLNKTITYSMGLLFLFGIWFRSYYLIIPILVIGISLINKIKIRGKYLIAITYGLIIIIFLSLSHGMIKGEFISQNTRETINEQRMRTNDKNANTAIFSPIKTDKWYGESFGIVYGFFAVNFPLNALKFFKSPHIILFVLWQISMFLIIILKYRHCIKHQQYYKYDIWAFNILISYLILQGVFEPDLGSAIRHKAGVVPLIYYLLNYENFSKPAR